MDYYYLSSKFIIQKKLTIGIEARDVVDCSIKLLEHLQNLFRDKVD